MILQFTAPNHVADGENVAMPAHNQEDSGNGEQRKHFLLCLWACIPPMLQANFITLGVRFGHINPSLIIVVRVVIAIAIRELTCLCSGKRSGYEAPCYAKFILR